MSQFLKGLMYWINVALLMKPWTLILIFNYIKWNIKDMIEYQGLKSFPKNVLQQCVIETIPPSEWWTIISKSIYPKDFLKLWQSCKPVWLVQVYFYSFGLIGIKVTKKQGSDKTPNLVKKCRYYRINNNWNNWSGLRRDDKIPKEVAITKDLGIMVLVVRCKSAIFSLEKQSVSPI